MNIKLSKPILGNYNGIEKQVSLSFYNPQTKDRWEEVVKPISALVQMQLLYKKWIKSRTKEVEHLSGVRLGYVNLERMNDENYWDVYSDILGKYNLKDRLVIDTQNNGGGHLYEDIEILFCGHKYLEQVTRRVVVCEISSRRCNWFSIMLVCEVDYSNAHDTLWSYKKIGLVSLGMMPVLDTMTSVNWETLRDTFMYFGISVRKHRAQEWNYLKNSQLWPDFKVWNDYDRVVKCRDLQLEKDAEELLREIDAYLAEW